MYGPPPDPRQVTAPIELVDEPWAYLGCLLVGAAISLLAVPRRLPLSLRGLFFCLGQTIILTMPLFAFLSEYVYGSFPTIDKEGSLLFYLDGVHERMLLRPWLAPADPAAQLIGAQTGHLWITRLLELGQGPLFSFNLQALLYPALGWWAAWLLLRDLCGQPRTAMVIAFGWGMGLHVFRDLNWYTIEKAAIFWLALYAWALHRAWSDPARPRLWPPLAGLLYLLMSWNNLYLGLIAAFGAAPLALVLLPDLRAAADPLRRRAAGRVLAALLASALLALPLVVLQWALMHGTHALGDPERFLWERAALDSLSLSPLRWNRLEPWRALNLVGLGLGALGAWNLRADPRVRYFLLAGTLLFLLSLGPVLLPGVDNPVYMAVRAVVPGFWRMAKPESFFHGTWLLICALGAMELARAVPRPRSLGLLYAAFLFGWVLMVRTHPAYPGMSLPIHDALDPGWKERVFR